MDRQEGYYSPLKESEPNGVTLDDFEIDGILGQGSNGTVYRATQFML